MSSKTLKRTNPILRPRLNNQITAPEVRVTDEKGESLGVMKLSDALKLSMERGVDLVEIVASANPPITKLISYDKYRFQKEKELKKERIAQKTAGLKLVQISAKAAKNDLMIKIRQLEKFMNEGHPVEISMRLRGREKYMKDWARLKMNEFLKMIPFEYKLTSEPKFGGMGMQAQIAKK